MWHNFAHLPICNMRQKRPDSHEFCQDFYLFCLSLVFLLSMKTLNSSIMQSYLKASILQCFYRMYTNTKWSPHRWHFGSSCALCRGRAHEAKSATERRNPLSDARIVPTLLQANAKLDWLGFTLGKMNHSFLKYSDNTSITSAYIHLHVLLKRMFLSAQTPRHLYQHMYVNGWRKLL